VDEDEDVEEDVEGGTGIFSEPFGRDDPVVEWDFIDCSGGKD